MPARPRSARRLACALAVLAAAGHARAEEALSTTGPRLMPVLEPVRHAAIPRTANLRYYGGPVVSEPLVQVVLWGAVNHGPFVTGDGTPSLAQFLEGVASSDYLATLGQYHTARVGVGGVPGTGQRIGQAAYAGRVVIAPSRDGARVDDAAVVAELTAQLDAGAIPAPSLDAGGHPRTVYLVYFPRGKAVTVGRDASCATFCAYHGAFRWRGLAVPYAVMPDMSEGSGCDRSCGGGSTIGRLTSVTSHELVEAITDPAVGLARSLRPPLAWYDPDAGEAADVCIGRHATIEAGGFRYLVQKHWSNADRACVAGPAPALARADAPGEPEPLVAAAAASPDAPLPLAASRVEVAPAASGGVQETADGEQVHVSEVDASLVDLVEVDAAPRDAIAAEPDRAEAVDAPAAAAPAVAAPQDAPAPAAAVSPARAAPDLHARLAPVPASAAAPAAAPVPAAAPLPLAAARTTPPHRGYQSEPAHLPTSAGSSFVIEEENDGLGLARTDSSYTQGLRVSARWAREPREGGPRERVGFAIGQNIYTPQDIGTRDPEALRRDRPYAGWLYLALLWDAEFDDAPFSLRLGRDADGDGASAFGVEVAFGTTGPRSGAAAVQTNFHRLLRDLSGDDERPRDPQGWDVYQIADGATVDLVMRYQFDVVQASAGMGGLTRGTGAVLGLRVSPRLRLDVGTTYDAAWAGLEVRAGLLAGSRGRPRLPFELYGFARGDGRFVAHDGMIQGRLIGAVTPLVEPEPWVADVDLGAVLRLGRLELAYAQLFRTRDVRPAPPGSPRLHNVGQVRVAFLY